MQESSGKLPPIKRKERRGGLTCNKSHFLPGKKTIAKRSVHSGMLISGGREVLTEAPPKKKAERAER